jgi:ParB family transcriptional regulator, chromosome partitioning protein
MADTSLKDKKIIELDIEQLQPNPTQPRGIITPESVMELADSIKEHGILEPLVVAHTPAGYQIVAGERRWRASKMAGLKKVPCIVKETSPKGMLEMAIVENVQREDLNPLERAKAFKSLQDQFDLGTTDIAKRIGKSPSYISNSMRLLGLPDAIKDGLLSNLITEGHARALLTIDDSKNMIEAYKTVLRESASVRKTEDVARRINIKEGKVDKYGAKKTAGAGSQPKYIVTDDADKIETEVKEALGDNTKVKIVRTLKQTRINIVLNGNPEETDGQLQLIYKGITGK